MIHAKKQTVRFRPTIRHGSRRADDEDLREKLRALAQQRRRFGYRLLHMLLRRDGIAIYRKKTQRLYREEGLTVRRRKGRKRAVGVRAPVPQLRHFPEHHRRHCRCLPCRLHHHAAYRRRARDQRCLRHPVVDRIVPWRGGSIGDR